jgi:hypothetical protein
MIGRLRGGADGREKDLLGRCRLNADQRRMLPPLKMAPQLNAPEYFYSMEYMQTNEENFKMYGISLHNHSFRKWARFYWRGRPVLHPVELLRGHLGIRIHYHQLMNPELSSNGILYFHSRYVTICDHLPAMLAHAL